MDSKTTFWGKVAGYAGIGAAVLLAFPIPGLDDQTKKGLTGILASVAAFANLKVGKNAKDDPTAQLRSPSAGQ